MLYSYSFRLDGNFVTQGFQISRSAVISSFTLPSSAFSAEDAIAFNDGDDVRVVQFGAATLWEAIVNTGSPFYLRAFTVSTGASTIFRLVGYEGTKFRAYVITKTLLCTSFVDRDFTGFPELAQEVTLSAAEGTNLLT